MPVFLDRIDAVPLEDDSFSVSFNSWTMVLVDTINESLTTIQNNLNGFSDGLVAPSKTQAEIVALGPDAANGTIWYCTDSVPPAMVAKVDGSLVQFTTSAFP